MAERRVVDEDILFGDAFGNQIRLQDVVRGARIDIIRAQQCKLLHPKLIQEIIRGRDGLLVWCGPCVEHVFRRFLAFILHRVEQQAVQFLNHRQYRFA